MTTISIFGSGNMGTAIASVLTDGGATVEHIPHTDAVEPVNGDIVVLAVPYSALSTIADAYAESFAGKTVVDITNPVNFETFDSLVVPADASAAHELAAALPNSHVVKAFNTNFAGTLAAKTLGDHPTVVLIAGDDADEKSALASVVAAGGLEAVDAGALSRARELEALGLLQMTLAASEKIGWTGGFRVVH